MKKITVFIDYPWCWVPSDEYDFEVKDNATEEEIIEQANEILNEMIWDRVWF